MVVTVVKKSEAEARGQCCKVSAGEQQRAASKDDFWGLPWWSRVALVVKNSPASAGDIRDEGSVPGLGTSPGGGHGTSLQCSCLENPMDRGAGQVAVHSVAQRCVRLSMHAHS